MRNADAGSIPCTYTSRQRRSDDGGPEHGGHPPRHWGAVAGASVDRLICRVSGDREDGSHLGVRAEPGRSPRRSWSRIGHERPESSRIRHHDRHGELVINDLRPGIATTPPHPPRPPSPVRIPGGAPAFVVLVSASGAKTGEQFLPAACRIGSGRRSRGTRWPEEAAWTRSHEMTRFLISFDDGAMVFPEEDLPDVAEAAHKVVQEAKNAGVWVFGGGLESRTRERRGHRRDGHRWPVPGDQGGHRRIRGRRRALTRGGAGVGCQDRCRLPVCTRGTGAPARPERLRVFSRVRGLALNLGRAR